MKWGGCVRGVWGRLFAGEKIAGRCRTKPDKAGQSRTKPDKAGQERMKRGIRGNGRRPGRQREKEMRPFIASRGESFIFGTITQY